MIWFSLVYRLCFHAKLHPCSKFQQWSPTYDSSMFQQWWPTIPLKPSTHTSNHWTHTNKKHDMRWWKFRLRQAPIMCRLNRLMGSQPLLVNRSPNSLWRSYILEISQEKCENTKGVIKGQTIQWSKGQTLVYKTLHRKQKIEPYKLHWKQEVNSCAPEG